MMDRSTYRAMGLLGVANLLLILAPLFIAPIPPFGPGADLVAFNVSHRGALMLGNYLGVIQLPIGLALLVFISAVTRQAEEASRGWLWMLIFGSGLCAATAGVVIAFLFLVTPLIAGLGQSALALLAQLGLYDLDISYAIQSLLLGAIGLATFRLRHLPAWLGYAACLAAALSWFGTFGLVATSGPFAAAGPVALFGAGLSLPGWILLVGLYWLVHPGPKERHGH